MHVKSFLKNHKKGIIASAVLILLYILIFEINFFFDPLRNKPDTIEVYKYGQKYEYHQSDKQFKMIYGLLRRYSKGTISKYYVPIEASYKWSHGDIVPKNLKDGIAVCAIFNDVQQDSRSGGGNAQYNYLVFLLDSKNHNCKQEGDGYAVPYGLFESGYDSIIINFPYPSMVEWYVNISIS